MVWPRNSYRSGWKTHFGKTWFHLRDSITCRITDAINSDQNEIHRTNHDYRKHSGNNESKSSQLKPRAIEIDSSEKELSEDLLNNSNININTINQNNIELPVNNNVDDINKKQGKVNNLTKSISQLSIDENSDSGIVTYDNKHLPSKNEYNVYKTENAIHGINVNLCHVLEKLQGSANTTLMF